MSEANQRSRTPEIILLSRRGRARALVPEDSVGKTRDGEDDASATAEAKLESPEGGRLIATVRWTRRAGRHRQRKLSIDVDPMTPPGDYAGTCEINGTATPLRMIVPRQRRLRLFPAHIAVEVTGEARLEEKIVVENHGNVPVEISHTSTAVLEPVDRSCQLLRPALAKAADAGVEKFLDSLVAAAAASTAADPIVGASIKEPDCTIAPGCSRCLTLSLRVPHPAPGRYRARLEIGGRRLSVDVISR